MKRGLLQILGRDSLEETLQQLSVKVGIPLALRFYDENTIVRGSGPPCVEGVFAIEAVQEGDAVTFNIPVLFAGEAVALLYTAVAGDHVEGLLGAAAANLETSFRFEAEIEDMSSEIVHVYEELDTIYSLSSKLGSEMDMEEICQRALEETCNVLQSETALLMLYNFKTGQLGIRAYVGRCQGDARLAAVNAFSGVVGDAFGRRSASVIDRPTPDSGLPIHYPVASALCIPLVSDNKNIGMIVATDRISGEEFRSQEIKLVDAISTEIAAAIKKSQLYEQINRLFLHTVEALASAIDAKDPYTYGHSRRVADYAALICHELNLSKSESRAIELASILHDIGKIGTPEAILQKPYRLMPDEIVKIKEHPVLGAQILSAIDELKDVIDGIRHHHEHYDGKGYPEQMVSRQIPIQARIIAVADCFDAMTSNRPYRKSLDPEKAIAIMEDCAGSQFDPQIFAAFKSASKTSAFKAVYQNIPPVTVSIHSQVQNGHSFD